MSKEQRTVTVVGPTVKQPGGGIKFTQGPREIPARLWENPSSRADLVNAGIRLASDISEPSFNEPVKRGPGRPSTRQKQIDDLAQQMAAIKAENEALKAKLEATNTTNDPAHADKA